MLRLRWFGLVNVNFDTFYWKDNQKQYTPGFDQIKLCALPDQLPVLREKAQALQSKLGTDAYNAFFGI